MGLRQEFPGATAAPSAPARPLAPRHKAAVIVRLLLSQGVSPGRDRLRPGQQAALARAMAEIGQVDRATLAAVVGEFTGRLDDLGLTMPRGLPAVLALLDSHISPIARDAVRAEAEAGDGRDPWARLAAAEHARLRPFLDRESAEVCAILLSKIGAAKAAALLADLPAERAQVIAHAVALTATVTPEMVERIGAHLVGALAAAPQPAFRVSPVDRVGAILNAVASGPRDALLEGLERRDTAFAAQVRRAIFTFQHIPRRVQPTDVPRILRQVDQDQLVEALAAGLQRAPLTVEFLLENTSRRLAEQLRDEAEQRPPPREAEGEAAMTAIVSAICTLEEAGDIRLIPPDEGDAT